MNQQDWEIVEPQPGTPKKLPRELDSTDCKRKSRIHVSLSAHKQLALTKEPIRNTRTHNELSSDSDEDLKALSKTIKKLHFENGTQIRCIEEERKMVTVRPFEIEEEPVESEDGRQSKLASSRMLDRFPRKLHLKKESFVDKKEEPPASRMALCKTTTKIDRLNSMVVDQTAVAAEEYLGDNIYIKNILRQMSTKPEEQQRDDQFEDTSRFDKDYEIVEIVGPTRSFSGNCFKVQNRLDRMVYFVKEVELELDELEQLESVTYPILRGQMEIYTADSENLFVRFYQSWTEGGRLFLVYEPASFTLAACNEEKRRLSEREVRSLLIDVSSSLIWLKDRRETNHLNLKPENVLNCRGKYKLMDMYCNLENLRKLHPDEHYLAPELHGFYLDEVVDLHRCDIYSLGLILLENMTGSIVSYVENKACDVKTMRRLLRSSFHYSPSLKRLILRMTSLNPQKRPTASELFGFNESQPASKNAQVRRKLSL